MDDVARDDHEAGPVVTAAPDRAGVMAEVAELLLGSPSLPATQAHVARAMVRFLGDWCTVTVLDEDGGLQRAAVASSDPAHEEAVANLMGRIPPGEGPEDRVGAVVAGGRPELVPETSAEELASEGAGQEQLALLRRLGCCSTMTVPLVAGGGRVLGAVTLVRGDCAGRYGSEELSLAQTVARLAASALENARAHSRAQAGEGRLRSFVDELSAILWEADPSSLSFSFVSRGAEELLGYPVQRWVEDPDFWPSRIHPGDRDYTVSYRRVATAEGRDHELEYRMVAADGSKVWLQDNASVDMGDDGRPRRLLGIMVDITRRKRAELVLLESRQRFASLARTLQASLLPPNLPEIPGLEVAARYRSAEDGVEVVGDFYDVFDVGEDGWGVVMGDVCGKGPEAAALTAVARHTVRATAMREKRPSRVLERLNEAVLNHDALNHDAEERFCTAVYARVQPCPDGVRLSLSCGGHPLPLVLRADGTVETAGRPGTLLGLFEAPDLSDADLQLAAGDAAVFFTDGATEAKHRGTILGEDRLRAIVEACAGLRAEEIASRMVDTVMAFQEGAPQDDLAIVVLRVPPTDGP